MKVILLNFLWPSYLDNRCLGRSLAIFIIFSLYMKTNTEARAELGSDLPFLSNAIIDDQ